jgi:hypothetical protein
LVREKNVLHKKHHISYFITFSIPLPTTTQQGGDNDRHLDLASTCHPSNVRTIRLDSSTGEQIQMFGLQVFTDSGEEVATKKVATQSSTYANNPKYAASKATDGDSSTFSHTTDSNASWEVDLGQDYNIDSVKIMNRWCKSKDDAPGCLCRLSNAKLNLLDEEGSVIKSLDTGNTCGKMELVYGFSYPCETDVSVLNASNFCSIT